MDREDIIDDLDENYSRKNLCLLAEFCGMKKISSLNKSELAQGIHDILTTEEGFSHFWQNLGHEARCVVRHLTWQGVSTLMRIESLNHIKLTLGDFYGNTSEPFVKQFKSPWSREILFSTGLRTLLKKQMKKPAEWELVIKESLPESCKVISSDEELISRVVAVVNFVREEGLYEREPDKKVLQKSIKRFQKLFPLNEPFTEFSSDGSFVRTELILKFFSLMEGMKPGVEGLSELLKKYTRGDLCETVNVDQIVFYPFVKGVRSITHFPLFARRARYAFLSEIKSSPGGKWISAESLVSRLSLTESTQLFDTSFFGSLLKIKPEAGLIPGLFGELELSEKYLNERFLLTPLCKGILALLYSLGAVDLALDREGKKHTLSRKKEGLTPYDSVAFYRLTPLGLKLFSLPSDWEEKKTSDFNYTFHSQKTLISCEGEDASLLNFFTRIGEPLGSGGYLVTLKSFVKECSTEEDVLYNLDRLEELMPEIPLWQELTEKIRDRIHPVYNEMELLVVHFPQENREFLDTILNREKIRKLFYMVEGGRGAFSRKNYLLFQKYMKEEGYLI